MELIYTPQAVDDLKFWRKSGNHIIQKKIEKLLLSIMDTPFEGIGKPEALKHELTGSWSRRIDKEHRLVYQVYENEDDIIIEIQSLKGHYQR
ncbi:Txe/YoeB family addiction module toxin [Sphingobacterium sp. UT-1RO-CII-1]|uniref:Txe/YoeB family addiction module toxin n=1 Tax=Sphingobacterium sp. UT-1RO-CII-1 TaxID=2995225 RepID=UPI00227BCFE3|nr:Txe/YoeB family addiction module toxin [Sphingobacterium sp. UT-1RO-CII-1]MCY4779061.1 Txe/YoeB family addiction module toxin [Sphingobacterium sp. UT-1RO-CII-1]